MSSEAPGKSLKFDTLPRRENDHPYAQRFGPRLRVEDHDPSL